MAHTCGIPLATQNTSADTAVKGKWPHEADTLDVAVAAAAAPGKKATTAVGKSKQQCKADDIFLLKRVITPLSPTLLTFVRITHC
jgi:hypothetical protein